ncbi:MAG: glycosyltransferase [Kiritimatiellae bacterium]|nr:glycosyltransferase [Kiritimatiellia bacterium]
MPEFPESWKRWRVVLGHDWLTGLRGGERVLEVLARAFPEAPILTLLHRRAALPPALRDRRLVASPLQRLPAIHRYYRWMLPAFPAAVRALRCPPCDLLITTSHCAIKAVRPPPRARHLCYCFTPMRYAWTFADDYFGRRTPMRLAVSPLLAALRHWDRATAGRVDRFATISRHVRDRIWNAYERDADVVYPPVRLDLFTPDPASSPPSAENAYDLAVAALVPYKRLDLAVRVCSRLQRRLRVVGVGSEASRLRRLAGPCVEFLGVVSDEQLRDLYRGCRCLIFPGEEDFGLAPVEAQACGRPVVAYGRGGAAESVVDGETGVLFQPQTEAALAAALARADTIVWDAERIRRNAERFSEAAFVEQFDRAISACMAGTEASR